MRCVETTVALKTSEFTESILEGVRDHGHYREISTISLFPLSFLIPPPFQTASQIKQLPLCPPTSYKLRLLTSHFYVKVYILQTFSFMLQCPSYQLQSSQLPVTLIQTHSSDKEICYFTLTQSRSQESFWVSWFNHRSVS